MFVTPAFAQSAGGGGFAADLLASPMIMVVVMVAIFWFLVFRPQQKRVKTHQAMLAAVRRGDTVVTTGGIVGKVTLVKEGEDLEVEISKGVKVQVVRSMISDVRSKSEPVNDNK